MRDELTPDLRALRSTNLPMHQHVHLLIQSIQSYRFLMNASRLS